MKILNFKKGFTTNSSGSYEWLPPSNAPTSSAITNINQNTQTTQNKFLPANSQGRQQFDWLILPLTIISGLIALGLIIKELIKTIKNDRLLKNNKKK